MADPISSQRIQRYLDMALRLVRREALYRDDVDWDALHREARQTASAARTYAGTHRLLSRAVKQAGGPHSRIIPPYLVPRTVPPADPTLAPLVAVDVPCRPVGDIADGVAVLCLPPTTGGRTAIRGYVATGARLVDDLAAAQPVGWVVDLRANTGGGMWPMLAVLAGLLDIGVLGAFAARDGRIRQWRRHRHHLSLGRQPTALVHSRSRRPPGTPIAVLLSARTASAGEAAAVALQAQSPVRTFGAATAGMTTGNRTFVLRDGTRLIISGVHYADADGHPITGRIEPDEPVADGPGDPVLAAAMRWLSATDPESAVIVAG